MAPVRCIVGPSLWERTKDSTSIIQRVESATLRVIHLAADLVDLEEFTPLYAEKTASTSYVTKRSPFYLDCRISRPFVGWMGRAFIG